MMLPTEFLTIFLELEPLHGDKMSFRFQLSREDCVAVGNQGFLMCLVYMAGKATTIRVPAPPAEVLLSALRSNAEEIKSDQNKKAFILRPESWEQS